MSARCRTTGYSILESEVELTVVVQWRLEDASIMVRDAYGETVDNVSLAAAGGGISSLVGDNDG